MEEKKKDVKEIKKDVASKEITRKQKTVVKTEKQKI